MSAFDEKRSSGEGVIGTFCHIGGTVAAECLALSGLDYVIVDAEHTPFSEEKTCDMVRAIELRGAEAFVRVRDSSRAAVLHALDAGARGIIIPDVKNIEEARTLVEYAKFFPVGSRGFAFSRSAGYGFAPDMGTVYEYFERCNRHSILMPQCETRGALNDIEDITALEGIDGIFVGPYDLSVALGAPARFDTAEFEDALNHVLQCCRKNGKLAFIYANTMKEARAYFERGYNGVAIGTDSSFLVNAVRDMLKG